MARVEEKKKKEGVKHRLPTHANSRCRCNEFPKGFKAKTAEGIRNNHKEKGERTSNPVQKGAKIRGMPRGGQSKSNIKLLNWSLLTWTKEKKVSARKKKRGGVKSRTKMRERRGKRRDRNPSGQYDHKNKRKELKRLGEEKKRG